MSVHEQDHYLAYANEPESDSTPVSGRVEFSDVKAATLRSLDYIIPMLLPGGKRVKDEWVVRNPTRNDKTAGSFSVNMRTGVWSDFAYPSDKGGDMIDLYVYIHGCTKLRAMKALADMLNVQAGARSTSAPAPKPIATAALTDYRVAPVTFPPRTEPDAKGKPYFVVAGDDGPKPRNDEVRRHVYRQGGVPVRIKIIKVVKKEGDSRATNIYRVTDSSGKTGWQSAKPQGFQQIPYAVPSADPFTAEINRIVFWVEGEKDVETVAVNSQLPQMPLLDADGKQQRGPSTKNGDGEDVPGEPAFITPNVWLDKNQAVEQMTWAPGLPMLIRDPLIQDGGWFDRPGASCFNLYRPPTIKLGDEMQAGRWLDHVKKVYPDDWDHIIKWLAHHVQHPEIKVNHNLILGGNVGVGKDTLLAPAVQAVGPWNCSEVSPDNLFEPFNEYLKAVLMRVSEARDIGDVSKFQLFERMKTIGAAPPETLRVNEKNKPAHHIVNIVGAIITTNHKTNSLYLPADDRRHYAAWSDVQHSDFDSAPGAGDASKYFDGLWHWYQQENGFEHVAAFLATLDLTDFNPKAPPFKTPAFWAIVDANRPGEESEISDLLETIGSPPVVTLEWMGQNAQGDLSDWFRDRKNRRPMGHRLDTAGYEPVRNDLADDGLWKVDGKRRVVYARKDLPVPEQFKAARKLADGCVWQNVPGAFPGDGRAFEEAAWKWSKPATLAMQKLHSSEEGPTVA